MPEVGNDGKFINDGGAGDGPVEIADFTNDPPEVIEGRTPQQQAADAQQAAREGSISAMTPEEALASQQKAAADKAAAFDWFRDGFAPGENPPNGMWPIYYQEWLDLLKSGKEFTRVKDEAHPVEEL